MTTGGDAVLAVARGEIGYVEGPNNSTKYWDWYGANLGSWCAVFVSWCSHMAGFPICEIDSGKGFVLVSNGTWHSYTEGMASPTNLEAQRTVDLQPGDVVLYSWEPWEFVGGVPTCSGGEWAGWTAGDHTGIVNTGPDGSGYFTAVEGNTSDGSADNGGMVLERTRHISQVCGWWRFPNINTGGGPIPPQPTQPEDLEMMTTAVSDPAQGGNNSTYVLDALGQCWAIADGTTLQVLRDLGKLDRNPPAMVHPNTFNVLHYCGIWEHNEQPNPNPGPPA